MNLDRVLAEIAELPDWSGCIVSNVASRDNFGNTPLHVAAVRGDAPAIQVLVAAGAEIDASGEHGFTPLHDAIAQGHKEAVRLLISLGASVSVMNEWGQNALDLAAHSENSNLETLVRNAGA